MPRKSSFLMGFETGQDLYNKGFSQAQQAAQMKLQKDAADQRGKMLDMQLRTAAHEEEKRNRYESDRKTAEKAFAEASSLMAGADTRNSDDDFEMHQRVWEGFVPDLMKNKVVYERYQMLNGITKEGMAAKRKEEADDQAFKAANRDSRATSRRLDADADVVASFNSQYGTNYNSKELGEVREWTIRANKLGSGMASGRYNQDSPEYQELVAEFPGNADVLQEQLLVKRQEYDIKIAEEKRKVDATRAGLVFKDQLDSSSALALELAKKNYASGKYNEEQFKALSDSWVKLRADKIVVSASASRMQFAQMEETFNKKKAEDFTPSDDLGFVFMFMKALDPGSVVRESEFRNAAHTEGISDRVRNIRETLLEGKILTPSQRREFLETARNSVTGMQRRALTTINSYSAQMTHMGLPDERFQAVRDMIGAPPAKEHTFETEADAKAAGARGELEEGSSVTWTEPDGSTSQGTWNTGPKEQPQAQPQPQEQPQAIEPAAPPVPAAESGDPLQPEYAAQHDAGNPDAYKTNRSFQKHFGHLDDAGQGAKWREVYEEYTTGGEWRHPDAPPEKRPAENDMGDTPPAPAVIQKPPNSSLGELPPAPKESSAARKLWEKDKLPENPGPDDNILGLNQVGKTITVRGEKYTVLEAGKKGMLVTDDEGNEYYISKSELPKEIAPPVPKDN
jgi:hypothetical protein